MNLRQDRTAELVTVTIRRIEAFIDGAEPAAIKASDVLGDSNDSIWQEGHGEKGVEVVQRIEEAKMTPNVRCFLRSGKPSPPDPGRC